MIQVQYPYYVIKFHLLNPKSLISLILDFLLFILNFGKNFTLIFWK